VRFKPLSHLSNYPQRLKVREPEKLRNLFRVRRRGKPRPGGIIPLEGGLNRKIEEEKRRARIDYE
jgi:hypothetical protein